MEKFHFQKEGSYKKSLKPSSELLKTRQEFSQQNNLEKQKQSQKENLHNKTNTSLQKLANVIYVEINGQEMTLEEFNKKYPKFSKKSGRNFVQSGEISDFARVDDNEKGRIEENFVSEKGGATNQEFKTYSKKADNVNNRPLCKEGKMWRPCSTVWGYGNKIMTPSFQESQQLKNVKKVTPQQNRNNISSPKVSSPGVSSKPVSRPSDSNVIVIKNHKGNSVEIGGGKAGRVEINGVEY